jgi:N-acetylglucosamine malate deacetylase 1
MLEYFRRVLVLAPHTDDGELGAGGTVARLAEAGAEVHYAAFSIAEDSVPAGFARDVLATEVRHATARLGVREGNLHIFRHPVRRLNFARQDILEQMISLRREHRFDLVLAPSRTDVHQDHATVTSEAQRAFKNTTLLGYELIWNNLRFDATLMVKLQERHVQAKVDSLTCYASQGKRDYMSADFLFSLARTRGVQIGSAYAEAFEVMRWVID